MSYYYGPIKNRVLKEKVSLPVPSALEYSVYMQVEPVPVDPVYRGKIKVDVSEDGKSCGVFWYPEIPGGCGSWNVCRDLMEIPPWVELAPQCLAVIVGKSKVSVLARAKREAFYLSQEPDALGARVIAPIVVDLNQKRIRLGFQGLASMASA